MFVGNVFWGQSDILHELWSGQVLKHDWLGELRQLCSRGLLHHRECFLFFDLFVLCSSKILRHCINGVHKLLLGTLRG